MTPVLISVTLMQESVVGKNHGGRIGRVDMGRWSYEKGWRRWYEKGEKAHTHKLHYCPRRTHYDSIVLDYQALTDTVDLFCKH